LIDIRERLNFMEKKKRKKRCVVGTEIPLVEEFLAAFYLSPDSKHNGALAACFQLVWICNKQLN